MNDLDLLRDLGDQLDQLDPIRPEPLATARIRACVLAGISSAGISGTTPGRLRRPLLWMIPVGAGLSAAALVTSMLVTGPPPGSEGALTLDARTVLMAAADAARSRPVPVPSSTAFVYTRSRESGYAFDADAGVDGAPVVARRVESVREAWLSVDGRHDGAVTPSESTDLTRIEGCPDPTNPTIREDGRGGRTHCFVDPAYLPDLPTDRSGALAWLRHRPFQDEPVGDDREAFANARATVTEHLMPPAARAAMFEAIASLDDIEVVRDATTVTGAVGVSVGMVTDGGEREELIFDPVSHTLIGTRTVLLTPVGNLPAGTVMGADSVLETAVVTAVALRPDGSRRVGAIMP